MILLISSHPEVRQCAPVLSRELGERIECAETLRTAAAKLHEDSFQLLLIDERLLEVQATALETVMSHAPQAVPLFFNPATTGTRRLVLESRAALRRQEVSRRQALQDAAGLLRTALCTDVTGILLSSQLALGCGAATEAQAAHLQQVCSLAERVSQKLA